MERYQHQPLRAAPFYNTSARARSSPAAVYIQYRCIDPRASHAQGVVCSFEVAPSGVLQKPLSLAYLLRKQNSDAKEITYNAYLGIRTPGLQAISRSPKYSVPIIYCKGLPLALSTHSCRSFRRVAQSLMIFPALRCGSATKSFSHRSSFFADIRSRVARSTSGSNGSLLCA